MSVQRIHDLCRDGKITPTQAAMLLELRREIAAARRKRLVWRWLVKAWRAVFG